MNINKALKTKNLLAKKLMELKNLLVTNNTFQTKNKDRVEYNTQELYTQYTDTMERLVGVKTQIAKANTDVYNRIFKLAELKGIVTTLKSIPVKRGIESTFGYLANDTTKEVEYSSTLTHKDIDALVEKHEKEIEIIQDELDRYNFSTEVH